MAKKLANDYRLWIETAVAGTYAMIKGQQDLSLSRNAQQIDTTSKDDYPYGTSAPGNRQLSISCSIIPDLPDANGYTLLETKALAASPAAVNFQIRRNGSTGADPADVVFKGSMYITDFNDDFSQNAPVKKSFTLVSAAAPTTDVLI
jgi:predicted secreted protein